MKEIVCVAPDGSLEVWEKSPWGYSAEVEVVPFPAYEGESMPWDLEDEYFDGKTSPSAWGRIVVGEL